MNMVATISQGSDAAIDALRADFGAVLAERIIEAEAGDFLWEARIKERYLGQQIALGFDDEDEAREISRVVILSALNGRWYIGMCLVDGEGAAVELLWKRQFENRRDAEFELVRAR